MTRKVIKLEQQTTNIIYEITVYSQKINIREIFFLALISYAVGNRRKIKEW